MFLALSLLLLPPSLPPSIDDDDVNTVSQFLKRVPARLLDPLPAELRYTLSRNFGFFTSVFTQFFDKSGVSNVQNSLGLGGK